MFHRQPLDRCGKFLEPIPREWLVPTHSGGQLTFSEGFFLGELLKPYFWSQQPQVQHQPTKFFLHTEGSSHLVRMLQGVSLPEECQNVDSDLSSLMPLISGDPSQLMIPVMKPRGWCPVWTEDMELAEKKKGKRATYLMVQGHRCIIHEYTYPYNMTNRSYDIWCIYGRYTYHTTYYIYAYHTDIYIYCVIFSHMKIIDSSTKQFSLHHSPRLMSHFSYTGVSSSMMFLWSWDDPTVRFFFFNWLVIFEQKTCGEMIPNLSWFNGGLTLHHCYGAVPWHAPVPMQPWRQLACGPMAGAYRWDWRQVEDSCLSFEEGFYFQGVYQVIGCLVSSS